MEVVFKMENIVFMTFFTQSYSPKEKADFLKQEYGTGGRSHAISGADNSNQMHDGKGIVYSRREMMISYF